MKLFRLLLIPLCISIAILGCRQDETGFIATDTVEIKSSVDLTDIITDPDGNPVSGASVQYDFQEAITNDSGNYILEEVMVSNEHASLKVIKPGYFSGSRTFRTS